MENLLLILLFAPWVTLAVAVESVGTANDTELTNSTDPNKDMYVIHAMVYQVGIITNKTENETANTASNQEAVTFFHNNGSGGFDLSKISAPLLTNVTAQSMVGVAPVAPMVPIGNAANQLPWSTLNHLANTSPSSDSTGSEKLKSSRISIRSIDIMDSNSVPPLNNFYKSLFKRDVAGSSSRVSIHSGATVIPQAAGLQSIAIPPLLTLNNNLSNIPVPIPNTSVVHYAKINTLVSQP